MECAERHFFVGIRNRQPLSNPFEFSKLGVVTHDNESHLNAGLQKWTRISDICIPKSADEQRQYHTFGGLLLGCVEGDLGEYFFCSTLRGITRFTELLHRSKLKSKIDNCFSKSLTNMKVTFVKISRFDLI